MKLTSYLNKLFAVIAVAGVASVTVCAFLGATSSGSQSAAFEYKMFDTSALIREAMTQVQQQQQGAEPQGLDIMQMSSNLSAQAAKHIENTLNEHGAEGWELAGVNEAFYILKRTPR